MMYSDSNPWLTPQQADAAEDAHHPQPAGNNGAEHGHTSQPSPSASPSPSPLESPSSHAMPPALSAPSAAPAQGRSISEASPAPQPDHSAVEHPQRGPRSIALLNQKGGVGKTTSSVNLAAAFAETGRHVCLIDLDPQAHVALHLGIDLEDVQHTVYDLLIDPDVEAMDAVVSARKNLDVIVSEVDLAGAETELATRPDRQHILAEKFAPIAEFYDLVLIDCPPSLGQLTLNALSMVQEVMVPMQAHFLALQGVGKLLETVGLVCQSVNRDLRVSGIILCMHEGQTTLGKEVVADLDAFFDSEQCQGTAWEHCRVMRPFIRRNIKLAEAPSFGQTIFDYAPWCKGALDYRKLAAHILQHADGRDDSDIASRSLIAAMDTTSFARNRSADQPAATAQHTEPAHQPAESPQDASAQADAHATRESEEPPLVVEIKPFAERHPLHHPVHQR